jgi:hypothetical protein
MSSLDFLLQVEKKLAIRRSVVLFITLWMTYKAFDWATLYASAVIGKGGLEAAAIIAAVTAPITYLQKVVFDAYISSKE